MTAKTNAKPAKTAPDDFNGAARSIIRSRRYDLGLSQDEVAADVGVNRQQIQKYETGVTSLADISIRRLVSLAAALRIAPTELLALIVPQRRRRRGV